ncbi:MAG TPA: fibronectin type III domain-containing protein [Verrucomicrobiae bacterium]|nr:fibronectin type III domain-containing protein [Verrucomicrobiae bacterium]
MRSNFQKRGKAPHILSALSLAAMLVANTHAEVTADGTEYNIAVPLQGDQAHADLALGANGGYLVWDDNVGDGDGLSVNLRRINASLSGELNVIPLATKTIDHQERPRVTMLARGGAAFAWQSGPDGRQRIYTRVINGSSVFTDVEVATSVRSDLPQKNPAIAGLSAGNYVVVWSSFGQEATSSGGSMAGVFGAIFGPAGQKLSGEFQVNQFTQYNQRNPAIAALPGGGFVVAWISEGNRGESAADVFARIYDANGAPTGNEFRVNESNRVCSSPAVAVTSTGNITFAWCESAQDANFEAATGDDSLTITPVNNGDGWDIYASGFTSTGGRLTSAARINQHTQGNQRNPSIAAVGRTQMVVWSSFGQDGDWEAVVGRGLNGIGSPEADEAIVNTVRLGRQLFPVVRGNGDSRFVAVWSAFTGITSQVDLKAQRFNAAQNSIELPPAGAPFVSALSQSRLSIAWPSADGYDVQNYELYVNGGTTPTVVSGQVHVITGLPPATTYKFQVAYRLRDGQLSPRSEEVTGRTWGEDWNDDGIPDDWQAQYWGDISAFFPSPSLDSDGDGISNRQEYMAGTNPKDSNSALKTSFVMTPQGPRLTWNTVAGQIYQVEQTLDFSTWTPFGGLRFAPGTADSVSVPVGNSLGYYRVNRIR